MTLRETLSALAAEGRLTPATLVEEARAHPGTPLHDHIFGVPDAEAADRWRLDRARELIRSFRVTYTPAPDQEPRTIRQFVSVITPEGPVYQETQTALRDPFTSQLLLQGLERDLNQLVRKYAHMREFRDVVQRVLDEAAAS